MERKGSIFVSSDPLDLGMTLWTAHWFLGEGGLGGEVAGRCFEQICILVVVAWRMKLMDTDDLFEVNRIPRERPISSTGVAFREYSGTCMRHPVPGGTDQLRSDHTRNATNTTADPTSNGRSAIAPHTIAAWASYMRQCLSQRRDAGRILRPSASESGQCGAR
ncbi:uncharacterized protein P174DRAFT_426216 [Aspergillus novofumigatus IBT 16806]|uniref:Uncharacterized protein n=1 Tax=Aspergillus novofumigatus (strain IBT 16806) TaxID=1392255 RepID=A0A2I1BRY5_ASPN1|nr:uncharacterized protein P174DRAFT_426216 [Aspergillus novofumigatus IBT 16806]PKX88165.1 hypothetical protein P174DRAFT_426216 [Aspergillus novofumigatus IBT 16806]